MRRCVQCGSRELKRTTEKLTAEFPKSHVTASKAVPAQACPNCGEKYFRGEDVAAFEVAVARELAKHAVHTGEAFRYMRKAVGLRAADLAELLDLTPETISRWENGKGEVDRGAFIALGDIVEDAGEGRTGTRKRLEALRDDAPRRKPLRLRLANTG